ncbi:MAG TPA: hypothetical protein VMD77_15310 [Candidatus Baltobacteraceae bacterium]|jgi:hypothetical protein|nr:hypothetical protein [Candidatus Baltobacteraceae bacterium]
MRMPVAPLVIRVAVCTAVLFVIASVCTRAQTSEGAGTAPQPASTAAQTSGGYTNEVTLSPGVTTSYHRPTESEKLHNFIFDAVGPYPFIGAAGAGGISQAHGTPREWGQGWDAYGVRVASAFGIALTTTGTRYALAEVFREDTLYYRCECKGVLPRLGHALISTVTARRGDDGHREFSFPALAAPYAGAMTATLGWYPSRYGPKDGFRTGNYNLLGQAGQNIALEFIYGGPHTLLNSVHIPGLSGKGRVGSNP